MSMSCLAQQHDKEELPKNGPARGGEGLLSVHCFMGGWGLLSSDSSMEWTKKGYHQG